MFAPNRAAAIAAALAPIAAAVAAFLRAVPQSWQGPVVIAGLICATGIGIVWLIGWQKHEARQAADGAGTPAADGLPDVVAQPPASVPPDQGDAGAGQQTVA